MRHEGTFAQWLCDELLASQCALLALYERADQIHYHDRSRLEQQYIELFGTLEDQVIREEMNLELLELKKQKIQTALNRREPIDETAIDAEIEARRDEMEAEAEGTEAPPEYRELTDEEQSELQHLYRTMVRNYHPATHPGLTEVHRELFQRIQDAYRRRDLEAMRLACDLMLRADDAEDPMDKEERLRLLMKYLPRKDPQEMEPAVVHVYTDYALAKLVYPHFQPLGEEMALQEEWNRCMASIQETQSFINAMQQDFPFTAEETMSDPEKTAAYRTELTGRLSDAKRKCQVLEAEIRSMIVKAVRHE